ncbi:MmgE/PrpD family protein [Qaidamihabitans albus]|uniref:MmgE/PrpD family protein n=1 Tax=Qaidamihabitans albus TaxID=2795733 RepID=UPI0018F251EC|nr:MmgE/PrpD family protein [Qaidamihabitans albus]
MCENAATTERAAPRIADVVAALAPEGISRWLAGCAVDALNHRDSYEPHCRQVLLDWCGVVLAGRSELPSAPGLGTAFRDAAAAHVLDYDDVNNDLPGHASATVVAAALAVARSTGAPLSVVWEGVLAGTEVASRAGLLCGAAQYERGWHPTATIGALASSVAAGVVYGFDEDDLASVIALASLQSSGALVTFGSIGKSWQTGCAARDGVHAAEAVVAGYRADVDYLGRDGGVLDLMADWRRCEAPPGLSAPAPRIGQTVYKQYATCFATHAAARCAEELVSSGIRADDVETITVTLGPQFSRIVTHRAPSTSLQAKFSVSTVVAMSLAGRAPRAVENLSPERLADPALRRLERAVALDEDPSLHGAAARVSVRLAGEETFVAQREEPAPMPVAEAWPVLREKFSALVVPVLGPSGAEELARVVETAPGAEDAKRVTELLDDPREPQSGRSPKFSSTHIPTGKA